MIKTPTRCQPTYKLKKRLSGIDGHKLHNANTLKEHLFKEILTLHAQKLTLETNGLAMDFSMIQVYKEMIESRRQLLEQLNHSNG